MAKAKIPISRFNRVAAAFDEVTRTARLCQSSGSEHSTEDDSPIDLSDLVASFMEREGEEAAYLELEDDDTQGDNTVKNKTEELAESYTCSDAETRERLRDLLNESGNYDAGGKIRSEVEAAMDVVKHRTSSTHDLKRQLMTILRGKGFDAGLCKSRWEKTPRIPAGDYQYIDIKLLDGTRLMVEPFLSASFQIARPTIGFSSLLGLFPKVYVGRPEEMKQVVRFMCTAIRQSMRTSELSAPPWRKYSYMLEKWFGSYKRTTNKVRRKERSGVGEVTRAVGFEAMPGISYQCREDYGSKNLLRTGNLAAAFGRLL